MKADLKNKIRNIKKAVETLAESLFPKNRVVPATTIINPARSNTSFNYFTNRELVSYRPLTVSLLKKADAVGKNIGNTPIRQFAHWSKPDVKVWAKLEWEQLSGSVKARAAFAIIRDAVNTGKLNEHITLLDATSGNTGIAYALIGKDLGIPVTLCLPENASAERKDILKKAGAQIIFTSPLEGTDGAQRVARELVNKNPGKYFYADQYKNENNWKAHYNSTAGEILNAVPGITHFVAALGTTGTFTGTARRLRKEVKNIELVALQPDSALHGLEGWKHLETADVPEIYDGSIADYTEEISTEEAYHTLIQVYQKEGLILSPSSAAALAGAFRIAEREADSTVVTLLADNGDKYGDVIKKLLYDNR